MMLKFEQTKIVLNVRNTEKMPFTFKGVATETVNIRSVKGSCGCTTVSLKIQKPNGWISTNKVLKDQEFIVSGYMTRRSKLGTHTKNVTVIADKTYALTFVMNLT